MPLFGENFDSQFSARTYREPKTPDRPTGQSAVEAAADYYFYLYKQEEAKREAEERQRHERKRQRQAAECDAAKRKAVAERQAQFLLEEELSEDLNARIGL